MIRKHTSKTLLAAAIALQASLAHALGLGDITLRSALDEPLNAEIRLRGVGDLSTDQIIVNLASAADFERAGVDRLFSLTEMRFEVEVLPNGEGRLHVRTERPVREPYLDFVVEVRWPTGRVLREYTVLLDLPTTSPAPPPVVRAAPVSRPAAAARPAASSRAATGGGTWSGGDSYEVRSGDTLWSIANRARPAGVTVQQMLVALHRDNPEAFIRGNMNLLRAGAVLRIPSGAAVSQDEAIGEMEAQGRDWRSGGTGMPAENRAAAPEASAAAPTSSERAYLELAAGSTGGTGAATGGVEGGTGSAALTEQLSATQENLSAKERENAELQSRVAALEEQVQGYKRLVELNSEGGAAAQQAAGETPPEPVGSPAPEGAAGAAPTDETPQTVTAESPPPAPAPEDKPGLLQQLMNNTLALGGAIAALFVLTLGFLFLRKKRAEASYGDVPEPAHVLRATKAAEARQVEREADVARHIEPVVPAAVAPVAAAVAAPAAGEELEHRDPVAEADILIAYGRVERAQEVLRDALDGAPEHSDVRLKLMEMLADGDDQEAFLAEYDQLVIHGNAEDQQAARQLLIDRGQAHWFTEIDQPAGVQPYADEMHPAVDHAVPAVEEPVETELARMDVDGGITHLDAELELDLDADLAQAAADADKLDEELALEIGDLDLDLGAGLDESPGARAAELDLDLDLEHGGLGDLELGSDEPVVAEPAELELHAGDLGAELEAPAEIPVHVEPEAPPAEAASAEDEADLGLLEGSDEIETKLELARAYVDMGDVDGARDILEEVVAEGSDAQREQASGLLDRIRAG